MQVHEITRTAFNELLVGGRLDTNYPEEMDAAVWVVVKGYAHFSGSTHIGVYGVRKNMGDALWSADYNNGNQARLQLENDVHCAAEWEVWHVVDDAPASDVVRQDHVLAHDFDNIAQGEKPRYYSGVSCRRCIGWLNPDNYCYQGCDWYEYEIEESLRQLREAGEVA